MSYAVAQPVSQPQMQLMNVQVPVGLGPGMTMQIRTPSGQTFNVTVPQGVFAGQTFQVQLPAAPQPVAVAAQGQAMCVFRPSTPSASPPARPPARPPAHPR